MDNKIFKILQELQPHGVGVYHNISPLILTFFPDVDRMNIVTVNRAWGIMQRILEDLKAQGYSDNAQYPTIGSGNATSGYSWIDQFEVKIALKQKGLDAFEAEINKGTDERLKESLIETNQSVRETNTATQTNYSSQQKYSKISIGLGISTTLFILSTVLIQIFDKTPDRLNDITRELQNIKLEMQNNESSLVKINSSLNSLFSDTLIVKIKK